ncbi:hypothetical protein [Streptomyces chartreusis]|uniref:hypothetical protein n=1 Tax=Streptomyces chartreusis TaxID=1969 RepID=UPI002E80D4CB|nr:hypothetical protein [Streptomyces chartreusis]WUB23242.1 hypothetical protein OG997_44045 [Streptomyces chartreusis]
MSDAVYGLLGAIGGAIVASAATFYGPLQLQKRALREAAAERASTHAQAEAARQYELQRAQIGRVAQVRKSMVAWDNLLDRTYRHIQSRRVVDPDEFRQAAERARDAATAALYDALNDGLYIPASVISGSRERLQLGDYDLGDPADSKWVLDVFEDATTTLDAVVAAQAATDEADLGSISWEEYVLHAGDPVLKAHQCRSDLSYALMRHVETITDVTAIETRGGAEAGPA